MKRCWFSESMGTIPAGNVMKSTVSVMNKRDSLYYTMTGEISTARKPRRWEW